MAWKDYSVSSGDTVSTPNGVGTVRRVSEQGGYAHVDVGGQLFETALGDVKKIEGNQVAAPQATPEGGSFGDPQKSEPSKSGEFKKGDKVKVKGSGRTATVSDVTQRTVKIKYTPNQKGEHSYAKKTAGEHLEKIDVGQHKQDPNTG